MPISRRTVILAAGGAGLALVGAGGAFVAMRAPERARRPWRVIAERPSDERPDDVRLDAFRHAILAPNPHNRQPWRIQLAAKDEALLHCDLDSRLPQTDPLDRQIVIGFGCFIELARIAAAERGHRLDVTPFPQGDPSPRLDGRPVALLRFARDAATRRDPLFPAIPLRRSVKQPFDLGRPVADTALAALAQHAAPGATLHASAEPALTADLRALTWAAWQVEWSTARTRMESVELMRIGRAEIDAQPDGIALGGPAIEVLALLGQITRAALADPDSAAGRSGSDRYRAMLAATPAYGWVVTPGDSRRDQLAAGSTYVRACLAATQAGLSAHPVSQALQEFPEMAATRAALEKRLAIPPGARLQMLARLGYGPTVPPAPRWPLERRLTGA